MSDFARRLGLPKSSIANLCAALEQADMVRRVNGGYMLGHRVLELGSAYLRARHDGTQPIRLGSDIGRRLPAAVTGLGKAMLAQLDPGEVEEHHRRLPAFPVLTPNSNRNVTELIEDLARTRERGYAIDDEEDTPGVTCYAVALPTADPDEQRRGVSVTLLKARDTDELRERLVADLRQLAAHLSLRGAASLGRPS